MNTPPILKVSETVDAEGALVITCFPSVGYVTSIVAHYLVEQLDLTFVGGVRASGLPAVCLVKDGHPMPPLRFYAGEPVCNVDGCDKLILIVSEIPIRNEMALPLSEVLLDWSKNAKVAGGVLIDSFSHTDEHAHEIIDDDESEETLLGIGATPATRKRLEEMEIPLLKQGVIAGMTGLLLGECRRRGLDTFAILAEANGPPGAGLPDARAAARIIEKLDLLFPNLSLPTDPLIEEAERIEEQIREMLEAHLGKLEEEAESSQPSGMLYG